VASAEIRVPPALDAPVVDLHIAAGLPAPGAQPLARRDRTVMINPSA
jgi:hypothetical protein